MSSRQSRRRSTSIVVALLLCLLSWPALRAAEPPAAEATPAGQAREAPAGEAAAPPANAGEAGRPLALVLSGGGARGAAHVGVLKVLEELHVKPDFIVGTSMGSIIGGLYAAGYSPEEIEALLGLIDWNSVFFDRVPRHDLTFRRKRDETPYFIPFRLRFKGLKPYIPGGVLGGQELEFWLRRLVLQATDETDFDRLPIPYRAVAMDLATSDAVVLDHGNLADAMRASMSVPGMLPPVEIDGRQLVDGGSAANLPVGIAMDLGAARVIAVNISTPLDSDVEDRSFLQVLNQLTAFLTAGSVQADLKLLGPGDVLIEPDLGDITFKSFDRAEEAVAIGQQAAEAVRNRLGTFASPPEEWESFRREHHRDDVTTRPVRSVDIEYEGWVDKRIVERRLDVPLGEPLDVPALQSQLGRLRGMQYFGPMRYDLSDQGGGSSLGIDIENPSTGHANLMFGASLRTDFEGDSTYALLIRHQWLAINRRAAEWASTMQIGEKSLLTSYFLQPLDLNLKWYVQPEIAFTRNNQALWADGDPFTEYRVDTSEVAARLGRFLGNWGNLYVAAYRGKEKGSLKIGLPVFPSYEENLGGYRVGFGVDTRDAPLLPRTGTVLALQVERNLGAMGGDFTWTVAELAWRQYFTAGKNTFTIIAEAKSNFGGPAFFGTATFLGGFQRLSGLGDDELLGDKGGLAALDYRYNFMTLDMGPLTSRIYAGLTLEAGNTYLDDESVTWDSVRKGVALYVGAATPIGPIYLGGGWTDPDRKRIYLILGAQY